MKRPESLHSSWPNRDEGVERGDRKARLRPLLVRAVHHLRAIARSFKRRLPMLTGQQLYWVGFVMLMLIYLYLLVTQPTAAGRGGR